MDELKPGDTVTLPQPWVGEYGVVTRVVGSGCYATVEVELPLDTADETYRLGFYQSELKKVEPAAAVSTVAV